MSRPLFVAIDPELRARVAAMLQETPPRKLIDIATEVGVSRSFVSKIRGATGVRSKRALPDSRVAEMKQLLESGHDPEQIAVKLGIGVRYVRRLIQKHISGNHVVMRRTGHRADNTMRAIQETIYALCAAADGLHRLASSLPSIPKAEATTLLRAISDSNVQEAIVLTNLKLKEAVDV